MTIDHSNHFNEPVDVVWKDVVPPQARFRPERLGATVQARIELESQFRVCGADPQTRRSAIEFTPTHRKVLVLMLSESDSPFSASLRAVAAATAGPLRLTEAARVLRDMAVDENEDRKTRLHAIESYLSLAPAGTARDLATILRSPDPMARSAALVAAFRTGSAQLMRIAQAHLREEKDAGVRSRVQRRVSVLNMASATVSSRTTPAVPAVGRPHTKR